MVRDKATIAPITSQTEIQSANEAIKNVFGATAAEKDAAPRTFRKNRVLPGFYFLGRLHKNPLLDTPQLAGGRKAEIRRRRIPPLQYPE
jgi:hypothetical protein